ncbi:MAG: type II toxin-antitoxin system RelE/ParE family toxin [Nitrospirae bacterium]|nr:type II toxin-antitoxin system RelE/ParE family toxin [Nitrospirota bacterium]MBF0540025.1 type II toxin-antitoxin system RelE/ParE family toxin [Nitrospirota bacterium]
MYEIKFFPSSIKTLSLIDKTLSKRIINKINWLAENIENINLLSLKSNLTGFYKLRIGDWRVMYDVDSINKIVMICKIGLRKNIYKL